MSHGRSEKRPKFSPKPPEVSAKPPVRSPRPQAVSLQPHQQKKPINYIIDDVVLNFSHHRGRTFKDVYDFDRGFCHYILSLKEPVSTQSLMFERYIKARDMHDIKHPPKRIYKKDWEAFPVLCQKVVVCIDMTCRLGGNTLVKSLSCNACGLCYEIGYNCSYCGVEQFYCRKCGANIGSFGFKDEYEKDT